MQNDLNFSIILYAPDIPGNTGSIGRTCLALNLRLILIKPYGFSLDEKAVRRAGLDYWQYVQLTEYESWEDFIKTEKPIEDRLHFFSKLAKKTLFEEQFKRDCYLVFGSETKGLPQHIFEQYPEKMLSLPIYSDQKVRSLNLSNAASVGAYEAIRQIHYIS